MVGIGNVQINKEKHVLLTTMSTLNNRNVNYYYFVDKESGNKLYCDGISSLEAGSKYILSQYPVDEIVVIGSKETVDKSEDLLEVEDLKSEWENLIEKWNPDSGMSAYAFYKLRMSAFLNGQTEIEERIITHNIVPARQRDIANCVLEKITELAKEDGFLSMETIFFANNKKYYNAIETAVKQSVEASFADVESYKKYIREQEIFARYSEMFANDIVDAEQVSSYRAQIENDRFLLHIEKEYLYVCLQQKVQKVMALQKESIRLNYHMANMRNFRERNEISYAIYYMFSKMNQVHRIKCLNHAVRLKFIDESKCVISSETGDKKEEYDNIKEITDALKGNAGQKVILHVDMQGGNRTSGYVRNSILQIMNNQDAYYVTLGEIVATMFEPSNKWGHEIVNERTRYRITDLVAGMNAFIRYGKADMIKKYCEDMGIYQSDAMEETFEVRKLVDYMMAIDNAISLCDMDGLEASIDALKILFRETPQDDKTYVDNIFSMLRHGIEVDYGNLIKSDSFDYVELIQWCRRKGFIQQALTLIESKMPEMYFRKNLIIVENVDENYNVFHTSKKFSESKFGKKLGQSYESVSNKLFYSLPIVAREVRQKGKIDAMSNVLKQLGVQWQNPCNQKISDCIKEVMNEIVNQIEDDKDIVDVYIKLKRFLVQLDLKGPESSLDLSWADVMYYYYKDDFGSGVQYKVDEAGKAQPLYFSFVDLVGTNKYIIKNKKTGKGKDDDNTICSMNLKISLNPKISRAQYNDVERIFLLHDALKKERNNINHAQKTEFRVPKAVVNKAIDAYVEGIQELLAKL